MIFFITFSHFQSNSTRIHLAPKRSGFETTRMEDLMQVWNDIEMGIWIRKIRFRFAKLLKGTVSKDLCMEQAPRLVIMEHH